MTTVQQLIDHLQQVKDKTRTVWLETYDCESTDFNCNGGYTLHLHTEPDMPDILILSELSAEERTEPEPDPPPTPYRRLHYGALHPSSQEVTRAGDFITAPIEP